jgi:hypothetical protein
MEPSLSNQNFTLRLTLRPSSATCTILPPVCLSLPCHRDHARHRFNEEPFRGSFCHRYVGSIPNTRIVSRAKHANQSGVAMFFERETRSRSGLENADRLVWFHADSVGKRIRTAGGGTSCQLA